MTKRSTVHPGHTIVAKLVVIHYLLDEKRKNTERSNTLPCGLVHPTHLLLVSIEIIILILV